MRALSIRQPWAWLAANGRSDVINLDWTTNYRGEFLIRAGSKLVQRDYRELAAQLLDQLHIEVPAFDDEARVPRGGIVGMAVLVGTYVEHPSPFFRGPICWELAGAQPLPFTPFKPPHSGPGLRWFDVPRQRVAFPTPGPRPPQSRHLDAPLHQSHSIQTMTITTNIPTSLSFSALPALRAPLADGTFGGISTLADGRHVAVVHLANADARRTHQDATAWAEKLGGELPLPAVYQMLIDTIPDLLPKGWVWLGKLFGSSFAWGCNRDGFQVYIGRSAEGGAVAVRLIPLTL